MDYKDLSGLLQTSLDKLFIGIGNEIKQICSNRIIEYQVEEYTRNYYSKTLLHRIQPKPLIEFYVPLTIQHNPYGGWTTVKDDKLTKTVTCTEVFAASERITLIGTAGSGKSTLVKHLFISCIHEEFKIPIKIELRHLNDYTRGLKEYIFNEIFAYQKLGITDTIIEKLLDKGDFLFFFDGYDEINLSIKQATIIELNKFTKRYNTNLFLVTSRPYTNIESLESFSNYIISSLKDEDITTFVKKQLPSNESNIAKKIIDSIEKPENSLYRSFLSNPLLLSMYILTFQSYADIPQKRSDFYRQVFETLFSMHDSMSKLAYVREKVCGLNKAQFEEILRIFSFLSFFARKFSFTIAYVDDTLNIIKGKKPNIVFENSKLLEDLQIAIGIFINDGVEFSFPHRSLQEYFAASYIQQLNIRNKKTVYSRLRRERLFLSAPTTAQPFFPFYNILFEQDPYYYVSELTIPILQSSKSEIADQFDFSYSTVLTIYLRLDSVFKELYSFSDCYKTISVKWLNFTFNISLESFSLSPRMDSIEIKINYDRMINALKFFSTSYEEIMDSINNCWQETNTSDIELISMIE